ncbi:MAG: hypothetical protein AAFZ07_12230 [Actinomycetota bacterium]
MAIAIAALVLAGCAGEVASQDDRESDIYAEALTWIVARPGVADPDDDRPVYIEHLGPDGIPLDVQVELIAHFDEVDVSLRFVDARAEAVDETLDEMPVRDGSVLVGLGPISDDQPTELRAELYRDLDDITAYRFTLRRAGDEWKLAEAPEIVDPEGLVADP